MILEANDIMRDMGIRGSAKPYSDTMGKGEFRSILRTYLTKNLI